MFCERTRRVGGWLAGLLAATVLLSVPTSGFAAAPAARADELAAAGTLERGAGYGTATGSAPVRQLQRRLRRLGDRPGPIDGLYGPLTEGAVERFQTAHDLATDGVVGPRTKRRLLAQGAERPVADNPRTPPAGKLERKPPAGDSPAESAIEPHSARSAPSEALSRAGPPSSTGPPAELLALLAAAAAAALLIALRAYGRRERGATVNFGMVCAALLAVFVVGAVIGAVFATQAAPDGGGETSADSGALLAGNLPSSQPARKTLVLGRAAKARRARPASTVRRPAPRRPVAVRRAPPWSPSLGDGRAAPHTPTAARAATGTYTVRSGDALWPIAERHLARTSSVAEVARKVQVLETLNSDRIASGNPDMLAAGEELRLP
jgi:peptidoglycan hydrolase-like protein with peptidoglycan-binding domain